VKKKHLVKIHDDDIRVLDQFELEALQTLPQGYTRVLNRNQAAHVIGNAWTVDVIAHILRALK
jgi:site-specific DNA-cytosine methylase